MMINTLEREFTRKQKVYQVMNLLDIYGVYYEIFFENSGYFNFDHLMKVDVLDSLNTDEEIKAWVNQYV